MDKKTSTLNNVAEKNLDSWINLELENLGEKKMDFPKTFA